MTPRHPLSAVLLLLAAPLAARTPAAPPAVRLSGYIQARETYQDGTGLTGTVNCARVFNGNGQNVTGNADSALLSAARVTVRLHTLVSLGVNVAQYFADSTRYGADANLEAPWLVLRAEIAAQHRDVGEGDDDGGWFLLAAAPVGPWLQPIV